MTVALDSSALLALHVDGPGRSVVLEVLETDRIWVAAATALGEAVVGGARAAGDQVLARDIEDGIRRMWDHLHVVPLDAALLDEAASLCADQPVAFPLAVHLAAATLLPRPVRFVTFDPAQIPVALSLGLDVVSG